MSNDAESCVVLLSDDRLVTKNAETNCRMTVKCVPHSMSVQDVQTSRQNAVSDLWHLRRDMNLELISDSNQQLRSGPKHFGRDRLLSVSLECVQNQQSDTNVSCKVPSLFGCSVVLFQGATLLQASPTHLSRFLGFAFNLLSHRVDFFVLLYL